MMRHMLPGGNVALVTCRQLAGPPWTHALVSDCVTDNSMVSNRTKERGYLFPLYLHPETKSARRAEPQTFGGVARTLMLFEPEGKYDVRVPNLSPLLVDALARAFGRNVSPEGIFHYVYAVLYAPAYRERYSQFLQSDFPRIPFTADVELFEEIAGLGERLTALHLLKSPELDTPACKFEGKGDNRIAKGSKDGLRYDPNERRVRINTTQYFSPVPQEAWEYNVGAYQVCEKWLKDRLECRLELEDIRTYLRIVTAISRTLEIQKTLDILYERVEGDIIYL
jgi:predicted helicase